MKKLSVVMAYYNRQNQLRATLKSISKSAHKKSIEIVIIDDGSDPGQKAEILFKEFDLDFVYHYNQPDKKTWKNPCYSFNIGFQKASGKIIILQNPECLHIGDVVSYSLEHTKNNYLIFGCKALKEQKSNQLRSLFEKSGSMFGDFIGQLLAAKTGWYNHVTYNPRRYHFAASILRENLLEMGGFDQRYADGYCFDDDEFLARMLRSPFPIVDVKPEKCFVIHQYHTSTLPGGGNKDKDWKRNHRLFCNQTRKETGWKAEKGISEFL